MSGICGWVGTAPPGLLERMLAAIDHRGDTTDRVVGAGFAMGYRKLWLLLTLESWLAKHAPTASF